MIKSQSFPARSIARISTNPWILLVLTMLMWGANGPVIRAAVGEISPMVIVTLRWLLVGFVILTFLPRGFAQDWQKMRRKPFLLIVMICLMTASNVMVFSAAKFTTAINLSIMPGATPVIVLVGARLAFGARIGIVRGLGAMLSIVGILYLATRGDLTTIRSLRFNAGDLMMLASVSLYGAYVLLLRFKPDISNYSLFCMIAIGAFFVSLPMFAWEYSVGQMIWPTWKGFIALLYVAFFTSMLGHIMFMRAVELVGPGRAAQFQNLAPIIGSILSVIFLGEYFASHHGVALAFVIGGIWLAERFAPKG